jgi:phosphate transport system substrate-binding protein
MTTLRSRWRYVLPVIAVLAIGVVVAGCGGDEGAGNGTSAGASGLSGEILIDGSSTVFPITEAVADEFGIENPDVRVSVGVSGSGGGFKRFAAGETAISDASRPIKTEEADAVTAAGYEFIELAVAYDGLSVVVNPENDWVDEMTIEELKKMWAPESEGTVMTWSDIRDGWPDEPLVLYGPGTDSGTFDYFTAEVNGEEGASRGDFTPSEDDNVLVQGVAGDKGALGYFGFAYYEANLDKLKIVPIVSPDTGQAVVPSFDTINSGEYAPLSRPLFIYVRVDEAERPEVEALVQYYLTEGPSFISEVGYVPLPDELYALVQQRYDDRITGSMYGGAIEGGSLKDLLSQ